MHSNKKKQTNMLVGGPGTVEHQGSTRDHQSPGSNRGFRRAARTTSVVGELRISVHPESHIFWRDQSIWVVLFLSWRPAWPRLMKSMTNQYLDPDDATAQETPFTESLKMGLPPLIWGGSYKRILFEYMCTYMCITCS